MSWPVKNTQYDFDVSLIDQANPNIVRFFPTLAVGDVKVTIDGGAEVNITTLPVEMPAGTGNIFVTLTAAEMNGDRVTVLFSDVAGNEWADLNYSIQTTVIDFDALSVFDAANDAVANVTLVATTTDLTTGVTVTTNSDKTGYSLSSAGIQGIWDALTSALTFAGSIGKLLTDNIDALISTRMPTTHINASGGAVDNVTLVATTTTNTDMRGTEGANTVAPDNAGISNNGIAIAGVSTQIDGLSVKKNTVVPNFPIKMFIAGTDTPAAGLTVTATVSLDGNAFVSASGFVSEVGGGTYTFNALAVDTNGDSVSWRFNAATASEQEISFLAIP